MKKVLVGLMAVGLVFGTTDLAAQGSNTANGAATVTIPTVLVLTNVTDLTINSGFDFSGSDQASATGTVDITTRSNVLHDVQVNSTPISDTQTNLTFEVEVPAGGYQSPVGSTVTALTGLARGTSTNSISFQATADVNTNDPGTYTGTITYTVIATP